MVSAVCLRDPFASVCACVCAHVLEAVQEATGESEDPGSANASFLLLSLDMGKSCLYINSNDLWVSPIVFIIQ